MSLFRFHLCFPCIYCDNRDPVLSEIHVELVLNDANFPATCLKKLEKEIHWKVQKTCCVNTLHCQAAACNGFKNRCNRCKK